MHKERLINGFRAAPRDERFDPLCGAKNGRWKGRSLGFEGRSFGGLAVFLADSSFMPSAFFATREQGCEPQNSVKS